MDSRYGVFVSGGTVEGMCNKGIDFFCLVILWYHSSYLEN